MSDPSIRNGAAFGRRNPLAARPLLIERRRARQTLRALQAIRRSRGNRQVIRASAMPEGDLLLLTASRIPAEAYLFDHELD